MEPLILTTDRLLLRQFNLSDTAFILELLNSPGWINFIGDRGVRTVKDAEEYLLTGPMESYRKNGFGLAMVALKESGTGIGMCGLIKRESLADVDIGYALLPAFTGRGYAFEIAAATLAYGKNELGLSRIVGITDPKNEHSIKLLRKLGLQFEKMVKFGNEGLESKFFAVSW